jgi:hypothetical protein
VINVWGRLKEFVNCRAVEEVVNNAVRCLTDERALKRAAMLVEILVELRLESLGLGKTINLEVNPPGTIRSSTDLPFDLQAVSGYKGVANLVKQIRPRIVSDVWINGDEHIVYGIALVPGDDADWYQRTCRVQEVVFFKKGF